MASSGPPEPHRFDGLPGEDCRVCSWPRAEPRGQHIEDITIRGIGGRILEYPTGVCVWCGRPTQETGYAPGLGRELPLHPLPCGAQITIAFRAYVNGRPMPRPWLEERARRVLGERPVPLLTDGRR